MDLKHAVGQVFPDDYVLRQDPPYEGTLSAIIINYQGLKRIIHPRRVVIYDRGIEFRYLDCYNTDPTRVEHLLQ